MIGSQPEPSRPASYKRVQSRFWTGEIKPLTTPTGINNDYYLDDEYNGNNIRDENLQENTII